MFKKTANTLVLLKKINIIFIDATFMFSKVYLEDDWIDFLLNIVSLECVSKTRYTNMNVECLPNCVMNAINNVYITSEHYSFELLAHLSTK